MENGNTLQQKPTWDAAGWSPAKIGGVDKPLHRFPYQNG
jgi:hypothetical protein